MLAFDAHDDALGVDRIDDAVALGQNHSAGIASGDAFHSGADDRSFGAQQRNRLALHVRAHQCAVGVVVLEERNQRCGHRNQLLRADVDVVDFVAADQHEVAGLAGVDQVADDACPCRRVRRWPARWCGGLLPTPKGRTRTARAQPPASCLSFRSALSFSSFVLLHVIADFVIAVAGIDDADVVEHASALDPAVGRLDEAVVVDARIAAQRRNQSDVRTFRRFNRADTAVVRRVHVADFESGALTRQTARPKGRETPLVRDLRQRVGLIHELRELRRSEEFADRSHHRLGVDQVVRHGRRHFLVDATSFP